ncbi:MAG: glycosyltransferase family 4 protein [Thermodesulfobacteriota bacterium]
MRILFVYQFCSLGGCETVLRNRLVGFREHGLAPAVVLLKDIGGGEVFAGFEDVTYPCSLERLERIVARGRFDVVAALDTPQVYPVLARASFAGTLVTEVHSNRIDNLQYLQDLEATATRLVITPSRYEAELIYREFPALRGGPIPLRVVPNPVDRSMFRFAAPSVAPPRKLLGWVGRLEPEKNWRHFVDVAAALARARADVDFLVVGGWAVTDDVKREFLAAVKAAGLVDRLQWVSSLAYAHMPRFYSLLAASGGALVPTSVIEPFGMSVVEAMACGCPVVASRAGAFEELIEHGRSGLTFEVNDTRDAVAAVGAVLDDGALRRRLVDEALARVDARWAAGPIAARWLETVRSAAAPAGARALTAV